MIVVRAIVCYFVLCTKVKCARCDKKKIKTRMHGSVCKPCSRLGSVIEWRKSITTADSDNSSSASSSTSALQSTATPASACALTELVEIAASKDYDLQSISLTSLASSDSSADPLKHPQPVSFTLKFSSAFSATDVVAHCPGLGYTILQPSAQSEQLADTWMELANKEIFCKRSWEFLAATGSGHQFDITAAAQSNSNLKVLADGTERHLRVALPLYFLDEYKKANGKSDFFIPTMKLLNYNKRAKRQKLHNDIEHLEDAVQRWSVIFFLHDTIATAMPTGDAEELKKLWQWDSLSKEQKDYLSNHKRWACYSVRKGAILIFRQTVAHFGVPDPRRNRTALFALISPTNDKGQHDFQPVYA